MAAAAWLMHGMRDVSCSCTFWLDGVGDGVGWDGTTSSLPVSGTHTCCAGWTACANFALLLAHAHTRAHTCAHLSFSHPSPTYPCTLDTARFTFCLGCSVLPQLLHLLRFHHTHPHLHIQNTTFCLFTSSSALGTLSLKRAKTHLLQRLLSITPSRTQLALHFAAPYMPALLSPFSLSQCGCYLMDLATSLLPPCLPCLPHLPPLLCEWDHGQGQTLDVAAFSTPP